MSGSGGGGFSGSRSGGYGYGNSSGSGNSSSGGQASCEDLVVRTQLTSPQEEVVGRINVDDVLDVSIQEVSGRLVVVATLEGDIAGGLTAPNLQSLRDCIDQGTEYEAIVTSVDGGQVRVRVQARKRS